LVPHVDGAGWRNHTASQIEALVKKTSLQKCPIGYANLTLKHAKELAVTKCVDNVQTKKAAVMAAVDKVKFAGEKCANEEIPRDEYDAFAQTLVGEIDQVGAEEKQLVLAADVVRHHLTGAREAKRKTYMRHRYVAKCVEDAILANMPGGTNKKFATLVGDWQEKVCENDEAKLTDMVVGLVATGGVVIDKSALEDVLLSTCDVWLFACRCFGYFDLFGFHALLC
jgi:hypothetical protein